MMALRTHQGIGVVDKPSQSRDEMLRAGLALLEAAFTDAEVFDAACDDAWRIAAFRAVHGNGTGARRQPSLFDAPLPPCVEDVPTGGRL